jgi:ribosomal protein L21
MARLSAAFLFCRLGRRGGTKTSRSLNCKKVGRALRRAALNTEKTMFAVIKTGGKQYKVAAESQITVMSLEGDAGARVTFEEVLALFDGEASQIGAPLVAGASVVGEIVEQTRGPKVIAFKKRRRKNSKRKRGHKQDLTIVKIVEILTGDARPSTASETAPAAVETADSSGTAPMAVETADAPESEPVAGAAADLTGTAPAATEASSAAAAPAETLAASEHGE